MLRFFKLVNNENAKNFRVISTYIMLGAMIALIILMGIIFKYNSTNYGDGSSDWRAELQQQNENNKAMLSSSSKNPKAVKDHAEAQLKINEYRLEHNIKPVGNYTLWGFTEGASGMVSLIALFTIIVAGGSVAKEFTAGTIKLLVIRPFRRWKLLLSKYISSFLFALVCLVVLFITSFLVGGIFFGFKNLSLPYVGYSDGSAFEQNMVLHIFSKYMYSCVDLLMMVTFAFMISAVFRNSALAIGISIFLMFTGSSVVGILSQFNYSWVKYILFANTDLTQYTDGTPIVDGMTMTFSLIVLAIYFVVFNAVSYGMFSKRDIAG